MAVTTLSPCCELRHSLATCSPVKLGFQDTCSMDGVKVTFCDSCPLGCGFMGARKAVVCSF